MGNVDEMRLNKNAISDKLLIDKAIKNSKNIDTSLRYDDVIIIDNFLPADVFHQLQSIMLNKIKPQIMNEYLTQEWFPWRYQSVTSSREKSFVPYEYDFQFSHIFLDSRSPMHPVSTFYPLLAPVIDRIHKSKRLKDGNNIISCIMRVRANLLPHTDKHIEFDDHIDNLTVGNRTVVKGFDDEKVIKMKIGVLYMTTTNGPTKLKDGTAVECIANRFVQYPMEYYHHAVSCTDEKIRMIINFNYF